MAPKTDAPASETQTPPAAETLPPEVEAQLTAAADQLESALSDLAEARAALVEADARQAETATALAEAQAEGRLLRHLNTDLAARLAAAPSPSNLIQGELLAFPAQMSAGKAPPPALRPLLSKGVKITVMRGSVEHPRADNGKAVAGESFFVEKGEVEALRAPLASGVLKAAE